MSEETQAGLQQAETTPPLPAKDAGVELYFDEGAMTVEALLTPPEGDGAPGGRPMLDAALAKAGVVFGIDEAALEALAAPLYDQAMVVARGTPARDGEDGTCTELFDRVAKAAAVERADGSVDYRELGLVRDLKQGTVICTITPPTPGVDGTNVKGQPVKARDGAKAVPLLGENTALSEDGTRATTTVDGNLVFRSGRFSIETIYRVEDVDYDVGNITFSGDVKVNGDIADGFSITAGGDVSVHGQVGSVTIRGRNITLDKGINGTGRAVLEAECTVKSGFLENCTVRAGEKVVASSAINCSIECEGEVDVTGGKGVICGGQVMALGNVTAKEVGNDFNTLTTVTLGVTPKLVEDRKRLLAQQAEVEKHIDELNKNVAYIEQLVADGRPVPPERVQMLKRAQIALPISVKKQEQLVKQIDELEARMSNVGNVQLMARTIHPPTKIVIGAASATLTEMRNSCRVFKDEAGEIVFGSR